MQETTKRTPATKAPLPWWEVYNRSALQEALTALHEAGHALVCYLHMDYFCFDHRGRETSIDPVRCAPFGCSGYCMVEGPIHQYEYEMVFVSDSIGPDWREDEMARALEKDGLVGCDYTTGKLDAAVAGAAAEQLLWRHGRMSGSDWRLAVDTAEILGYRGKAARKQIAKALDETRSRLCQEKYLLPLILVACALLVRKTIPDNDCTVESLAEFAPEALADRWPEDEAFSVEADVSTGIATWSAVLSVIERLLQAKVHPDLTAPLLQLAAAMRDCIYRYHERNNEERLIVSIFGAPDLERYYSPHGLPELSLEQKQLRRLLRRFERLK